MTAMQTAGTVLQLVGAVITGSGLLYAWNRASGQFDQWRQGITSKLAAARARVTGRYSAVFSLDVTPSIRVEGEVFPPPGSPPEDRLLRVEQTLAELPGRTKKEIEAVEAAIDKKLAEFDATGKGFAVKDIYWALAASGSR